MNYFADLEPYYQYASCINKNFYYNLEFINNNKIDPVKVSELQLLSISLMDVEDTDFNFMKELLNILNSYLAAFSLENNITDNVFEFLSLFTFILYLLLLILSFKYGDLANQKGQVFDESQLNYIFTGNLIINSYQSNMKLNMKSNVKLNMNNNLDNFRNKDEVINKIKSYNLL